MPSINEPAALVNAAVSYATKFRWRVIPLHTMRAGRCTCGRARCNAPGKHSRLKNWTPQATTDPQIIGHWFGEWWPTSNVGVLTGLAGADLVVLDVDGDVGDESLADLERRHGPLPDTPRSLAHKRAPSPEPIAPPSAADAITSDPPSSCWATEGPGR
jgi:hypothetical protein